MGLLLVITPTIYYFFYIYLNRRLHFCSQSNGTKNSINLSKRDEDILQAIRNNKDHLVFNELYKSSFQKIKGFVLKSGGQVEDVKDIFQDALLTLIKKVKDGSYEQRSEIDGFLYGVARNMWYYKLRQKKNTSDIDDFQEIKASDQRADFYVYESERSQLIQGLFERLGQRCKELLTASIFDGKSLKEICAELGFSSINSAKTKNYKCKQRLIKLVGNNLEVKEILSNG